MLRAAINSCALPGGWAQCRRFMLAIAAGFSLVPPGVAADSVRGPVWPPPPAQPCIVYRGSIARPVDIGAKPSALGWLARQLTGSDRASRDLARPFGLSLDDAGNLLVTDTAAGRVCYLDRARKKWLQWEQVGQVRFKVPVAMVRQGRTFYVADSGLAKVIAFDEKGKIQWELTRDLERPSGLAIHRDKLYVADARRHAILEFNLRGELLAQFGRRGAGPGEFNYPTHITLDTAGRLYITDSMNFRVQVLDGAGHFLRAVGSAGDAPGHFSRPKGVAVSQAGHLYVVDALFDNVQIFDGDGRVLLNWGESGAGPGQFWLPNGIAISRDDWIFVADSFNHRIQMFQYLGHP